MAITGSDFARRAPATVCNIPIDVRDRKSHHDFIAQADGEPGVAPMAIENEAERLALYRAGKSDAEMGRCLGLDRASVRWWRRSRGLAVQGLGEVLGVTKGRVRRARLDESEDVFRRQLYEQRFSDIRIAAICDRTPQSIADWRRRRALPNHYPHPKPWKRGCDSDHRMALYRLGCSDNEIARRQDVVCSCVRNWRRRRGLKANYPNAEETRGTGDGRMHHVSLDAPDSLGRLLYERTADSSWSDWLEEMGATVW